MKSQNKHIKLGLFLSVIILMLLGGIFLSISIGAKSISFSTIWEALVQYNPSNGQHIIVRTLRMPRVIVALVVGASFAVSGALMQAITRNPMASPSILGINAGAALGLAVAMVILPSASFNHTVLFSFAGAAVASLFIFGMTSMSKAGNSPLRLALVGTAITALFNAFSQAIAVYFNISQELTFWNAGGVSGVRPEQALLILPWTVIGLLLALSIARSVTLLSLGEEVAVGLGGKTRYIKIIACIAVLILTGSSVAIVGPIGFVGLVVPHAVKFIVGVDYRKVIPFSMLVGALLVLIADIISRSINPPFETPIGAITALIGVPFFIYLATRKGKS